MSPYRKSNFGKSGASTQLGTTFQKSGNNFQRAEHSPIRQPDYGYDERGRQSLFDSRGFEQSPAVTGYIKDQRNTLTVQK